MNTSLFPDNNMIYFYIISYHFRESNSHRIPVAVFFENTLFHICHFVTRIYNCLF